MKVKVIVVLFFLFTYLTGKSQVSCWVDYKVFLNGIESKGMLSISKENTPYYSEQLVAPNEKKLNRINDSKPKIQETGSNASINFEDKRDYTRKTYQLYNKEKNSITNIAYIGDEKIMYTESLSKIKWEISNEHKKIADYDCIKAKCVFRGRSYSAWFTTDIPIQLGPWKFNGLPGLIIEISDEKVAYTWSVTKIKFTENPEKVRIANSIQVYSFKDFVRKDEAYIEKEFKEKNNIFLSKLQTRGIDVSKLKVDKVTYNRGRELKYDWEE